MTEFSWKWDLSKRRLSVDNKLFEDGDIMCYSPSKQIPDEDEHDVKHRKNYPCELSGCGKAFKTISEYEVHYNSVHSRTCHVCHRSFPSNHLLDIHLLEWHDSMFELMAAKQPMYQCLVEACTHKFLTKKGRKNHLIKVHKYPSNYRFDRGQRPSKNDKSKSSVSMEVEVTNVADNSSTSETFTDATKAKSSSGMETHTESNVKQRVFSYKVPKNICFGQGASKGFQRGRGRGHRKHWHNKQDSDTTVNIENIDMSDLVEAL